MSVIMRNPQQQFKDDATNLLYQNLQNCDCCPYGYHIDLDFVRYCESLVGEKPSIGQLLRRDKRRSRKSIEIMLGLDTLCFWEPNNKVQPVKEVQIEAEPESPRVVDKIHNYSPTIQYSYESSFLSTTTTITTATTSAAAIITTTTITTPSPTTPTTTNSSPETSAFLHDVLYDVVNDFERTLERTTKKRNKIINIPWEQYIDVFDSCVSGNKTTTTTTVKKDVSSQQQQHQQQTSQQQQQQQQLQLQQQEKEEIESIGSNGSELDTQTLQNIREQMAKSLNRMKELEEQVKKIPILQKQLNAVKEEKRQLELQLKREEATTKNLLNHVTTTAAAAATTTNHVGGATKSVSPPFTPQKVSPVALESLGSHIRSDIGKKVMKRDVASMCVQHTRDASTSPVSVSSLTRTTGTNPLNTASIKDRLYTNPEVEDLIKGALREYEDRKRILRQRNSISVGTQMASQPKPQLKHIFVQTINFAEKLVPKMSQGIMAVPLKKDAFVTVRPETRTIGCSDHKITNPVCDKCSVSKRTVGCGPDSEENKNYLSLKQLDMPPRSLSFSLGEYEKLNIKRKTIGTQYQKSVHNIGIQSTAQMESIGIQNSVISLTKSCQYSVEGSSKCTDTEDLILLVHKNTNTDEMKPITVKTKMFDKFCNTDSIRKRDFGTITTTTTTSTVPSLSSSSSSMNNKLIKNTSSNTDRIMKKDASCGDNIKPPHISISCADNYCDSCKDAIKNLAREFSSSTKLLNVHHTSNFNRSNSNISLNYNYNVNNSNSGNNNGTKIPRPTTLTSPRSTRKLFLRQNTYTISTTTPSPSPSSVIERKIIGASSSTIDATKRLSASLDSVNIVLSDKDSSENLKTAPNKTKDGDLLSRSYHEEVAKTSEISTIATTTNTNTNVNTTNTTTTTTTTNLATILTSKQDENKSNLDKLVAVHHHNDDYDIDCCSSKSTDKKLSCIEQSTSKIDTIISSRTDVTTETAAASIAHDDSSDDTTAMSNVATNVTATDTATVIEKARKEPQKPQSSSSHHLQNTILLNQLATSTSEPRTKTTPSKEMKAAMKVINDSIQKSGGSSKSTNNLKNANAIVQKEWFKISSTDSANPMDVEDYLDCFEEYSNSLLKYIVNMIDSNGNTAMHYAVSHGNFDVVSILLDSKVCNVNQMNNAGYTSVMLVSLAKLKNSAHRTVVQRLFQMADVNIRAKKHCQTALMLAVSHGNLDMVEMLLNAGADINIQDEDGSTALMCAAEHGRIDIVKHLLSQPDCDSLIQDVDGSTAFKIAWQAGHRDIGLLLYVHEQMLRSKMPNVKPEQRSPATPRHQKAYQMHQQQQQQQQQQQHQHQQQQQHQQKQQQHKHK